LELEAH